MKRTTIPKSGKLPRKKLGSGFREISSDDFTKGKSYVSNFKQLSEWRWRYISSNAIRLGREKKKKKEANVQNKDIYGKNKQISIGSKTNALKLELKIP